ncbi:MAG: hypothetical protein DWQ40_02375 [Actinobacteria bacterium]|nr:MAG: hypothetical protein DWQ40_02375 [Actinomycetota bacterium]REK37920.1 MAG: hypothetical protein DWQ20_04300 [Actinomycetota bacterium]
MRGRLLLAILMAAVACTASDSTSNEFILDDGSIVGPERVLTGQQTLRISNVGEFIHTLVVTDQQGNVVAATDVIPAGASSSLAVDLSAGDYLVSCRLVTQTPDGSIVDHFEMGMWRNIKADG